MIISMSRIHPSDNKQRYDLLLKQIKEEDDDHDGSVHEGVGRGPLTLTVWKRSSMSFQGTDGFTVFDDRGTLVFRVDNYSRKNPGVEAGGGLLLMDGAGNALLTLKPQIRVMSMRRQWNAYRGEEGSNEFTMRSVGLMGNGKDKAEVFMGGWKGQSTADLRIQGSFRRRKCLFIRNGTGEVVAKTARKRAANNHSTILLGDDVFSLFVYPGFDHSLAMAFLVILDRLSAQPYSPLLCS